MSLVITCGWSVLRGLTVAMAAAPLCWSLARFLQSSSPGRRKVVWAVLLVPFLTPDLLVGYAYGNFGWPLVHYPILNELLYAALLWMKLVPIGTAVMYFSPPPPVTAEARHCRRLLAGNQQNPEYLRARLGDFIRGPLRHVFPAAGLMFLLAFQEFELGSLLGITAGRSGSPIIWTRVLFDAQAGVIDRAAPLKWSLWPIACELTILLPLLWLAARSRYLPASEGEPVRPARPIVRLMLWGYLGAAVIAGSVLPFLFVIRESVGGVAAFAANREQLIGLGYEVAAGLMFASVAGIFAYVLAGLPLPSFGHRGSNRVLRNLRNLSVPLLFPGLAGSLIVGLAVLYLFQTDWLYLMYDTPVPLGIALILFLAPRAFLLQLLLRVAKPREPLRLAELLRQPAATGGQRRQAGALLWNLERQGHFWAVALLAFWAYWDLTSPSILAPTNMVPAPVRLYNLMHYGHNAILSTMTLLAVAVPLLVVFVGAKIARPLSGRFL